MSTAFALIALLAAASPAPPADETDGDPSAHTILAEMALERGDCKGAAENYLAAVPNADTKLIKRASEVALACEHMPAAWAAVQRWRVLAPDDPDAASVYAAVALRLYKIPEAQAAVRTVLAGSNAEPKIAELTVLLLDQAEAPTVLSAIAGAVDDAKASPAILTLLAELALDAHDLKRAEGYGKRAIEGDPKLYEPQSLMGQIYAGMGEDDKALAAAQAAMEIDPKRGEFEVAQTLIELHRLPEAHTELDRMRAKEGDTPGEVDRRLALLALQEGDLEEAKNRYLEMSGIEGSTETAAYYLAEIAALEGDKEHALTGFRLLFDSTIGVTARTRAAAMLLDLGKKDQALAIIDDYIAQRPEAGFELIMTKARLLSDHGDPEGGLAIVDAALERYPQHPALKYDRAVLLESAGKVRESVAVLEQLLEERPGDPNLLNALGYTLAEHGMQLSHAESLIRRALTDSPDNPAVIDSLGWVRFQRGDARGAAPILERAFTLSRDAEIAAHWGEALWKSGHKQKARSVWTDALVVNPDSKALQAVMGRFAPAEKKP